MGKLKDLKGQKFNNLLVIGQDKTHIQPNGTRKIKWLCLCDCGKTTSVTSYALRNGSTKSCGCLRKTRISKNNFKDLRGQIFDRLLVLYRGENSASLGRKSKTSWVCLCECGRRTTVFASSLQRGTTRSCGCLAAETVKSFTNLSEERFGRLSVLSLDVHESEKQNRKMWLCQCDCGKLTTVRSSHLTQGLIQSCGCLATEKLRARTGAKNPCWKGRRTSLIRQIRKMPEYIAWRTSVFVRDKRTCTVSGIQSEDIVAHHLVPLYQIIEEQHISNLEQARNCKQLWDVNNGVTLLRYYHNNGKQNYKKSYHNVFGTNKGSVDSFLSWKQSLLEVFDESKE